MLNINSFNIQLVGCMYKAHHIWKVPTNKENF